MNESHLPPPDLPDLPDLPTAAARVLHLRARREALKREYEAADKVLTDEMASIELVLRQALQAAGATSIRTPAGTVLLQETIRYWPSDWQSMYDFISEHAAFHLLERRIHNTNMTQFLRDHPGDVPVGLNIEVERKAVVRKPTTN
jgi:hypothetical protein